MIDAKRTEEIQKALDEALQPFLAANALKLTQQKATYYADSTSELKIALSFMEADANPYAEEYKLRAMAEWNGLSLDWLDKTFESGGKTYKVIGYKKGRRKKPIVVEEGGKQFLVPLSMLHNRFGDPRPDWAK